MCTGYSSHNLPCRHRPISVRGPEDCLKKNATPWDEHSCGGGELKLSPSVDSWDRFLPE